jgi:Ca2+-binding RTX toxin-like protein
MATYTGTATANHIIGSGLADTISGRGGNDTLEGRGGNDMIDGGSGNDIIYGGGGSDRIIGGTGNDTLSGGVGNDTFVFASGGGQDRITDLASGDMVQISGYSAAQSVTQVGADVVVTLSSTDKVTFSNASLTTVKAALQFASGSVGGTGATITGTNGGDVLNGTAGNDVIMGLGGYDVIHGGGGNDRIYGGLSGDGLYGGTGADVFVYTSAAEAPPYGLMYTEWDTIYDFQAIDKIDLSAVDANSTLAGKQSFHLVGYSDGAPANHSPGSLYIGVSGGYVWLFGYTDNSAYANFYIDLNGGTVPTGDNLIL